MRRICFVIYISLILSWASASLVHAQLNNCDGGLITTKGSTADQLNVRYLFESSGVDVGGQIHFEVAAAGASPRERNIELRLYSCAEESGGSGGVLFKKQVTLPEGATSIQASIPFYIQSESAFSANQSQPIFWDVGVFEDGDDVEQSRYVLSNWGGAYTPMKVAPGDRPDFHILSRSFSNSTTLQLLRPGQSPNGNEAVRLQVAQINGNVSFAAGTAYQNSATPFDITRDNSRLATHRHTDTAPIEWQYYLQYRLVALDVATLMDLQKARPGLSEALKKYIAAGGNLVVTGSPGADAKSTVDRWLGAKSSNASVWEPIHSRAQPGEWMAAIEAEYLQSLQLNQLGFQQPMRFNPATQQYLMQQTEQKLTPEQSASIRNELSQFIKEKSKTQLRQLTKGGVLSDAVSALDLWWQAKSASHYMVLDEFVQVLMYDDAGLMGDSMSGMGLQTGFFPGGLGVVDPQAEGVDPTQPVPSKLLVDWRTVVTDTSQLAFPLLSFDITWIPQYLLEKAELAVSEIERHEPSGVSVRAYLLGRIATVEPGLGDYPMSHLQKMSEHLTSSIGYQVNSLTDGNWSLRNMIETVGKPPVWTFCTIVLLFGLVLGPGLLVLTGWIGRRSLMILLVPALSLLTTFMIMIYAVLHEGFGTTIRVTSVMSVDQETGQGFAWSRQTYFTGWPPREGLQFPNDVYFRPTSASSQLYYGYYYRNRGMEPTRHPRETSFSTVRYNPDNVQWSGSIKPRQQQQLLIGHPVKASPPIAVKAVDRKSIELTNVSQHHLPFVVVRDGQSGYYLTEDLAPGGSITLQPRPFEDVAGILSRFRGDNLPDLPQGMRGTWWNSADQSTGQDVMDVTWSGHLSEFESQSDIAPYGFVTLLPEVPEVYVPLKGSTVESKTLTVGRLAW